MTTKILWTDEDGPHTFTREVYEEYLAIRAKQKYRQRYRVDYPPWMEDREGEYKQAKDQAIYIAKLEKQLTEARRKIEGLSLAMSARLAAPKISKLAKENAIGRDNKPRGQPTQDKSKDYDDGEWLSI